VVSFRVSVVAVLTYSKGWNERYYSSKQPINCITKILWVRQACKHTDKRFWQVVNKEDGGEMVLFCSNQLLRQHSCVLHTGQRAYQSLKHISVDLSEGPHHEYPSRYNFQHHFALWPVQIKTWNSRAKLVISSKMRLGRNIQVTPSVTNSQKCQLLCWNIWASFLFSSGFSGCWDNCMSEFYHSQLADIIPAITISLWKAIHNTIPMTYVLYHKFLHQSQCNFHCVLRICQPHLLQTKHFLYPRTESQQLTVWHKLMNCATTWHNIPT
jgi:hypothetical protein